MLLKKHLPSGMDIDVKAPLSTIIIPYFTDISICIELVVTWDEGENHFFTGLKPELGLGYADFVMTPSVVYSVRLADGGQPVNDLTAAECQAEDGSRFWGSWLLIFVQP